MGCNGVRTKAGTSWLNGSTVHSLPTCIIYILLESFLIYIWFCNTPVLLSCWGGGCYWYWCNWCNWCHRCYWCHWCARRWCRTCILNLHQANVIDHGHIWLEKSKVPLCCGTRLEIFIEESKDVSFEGPIRHQWSSHIGSHELDEISII